METSGLSAAQPLLILVVGIPSSGKTFFARQFSDTYKFFYIDNGRNEVELEALSNSFDDISIVANKITNNTLEQALKCYKHVMLEGSYYSLKERREIISKAKKAGFGTLIVWVQTDEATAEHRALNRDRRRADDKYSLQINKEQFDNLNKSFQKLDPKNESFVVVSGKHDFKSQSVILLKKIASMYVNNLNISGNSQTSPPTTKTILR